MALFDDTFADIVDSDGHCLNHPAIKLRRLNSRTGTWKTLIPGGCPLCDDRDTPPPPSGRPRSSRSGAAEKDFPTTSSAATTTSSSSSRSGGGEMLKGLDANSKGSGWIKGTSGEETLDERWREAAAEPPIVDAADVGECNNDLWESIDIPPSLTFRRSPNCGTSTTGMLTTNSAGMFSTRDCRRCRLTLSARKLPWSNLIQRRTQWV